MNKRSEFQVEAAAMLVQTFNSDTLMDENISVLDMLDNLASCGLRLTPDPESLSATAYQEHSKETFQAGLQQQIKDMPGVRTQ